MNKNLINITAAAALACLPLVSSAAAQKTFSPDQQKDIESIIENYLVKNPSVLERAGKSLQQQQAQAQQEKVKEAVVSNADQLFAANSPVLGNDKANVTIVEFFDYQCGHCKRMGPVINNIVKADENVKVVYKVFPIFGEKSEFATKAALAARKQSKFHAFHDALLNSKTSLTKTKILDMAEELGLNIQQLEEDMKSVEVTNEIEANTKLARALNISGTPAFIIASSPFNADKKIGFVPGATTQQRMEGLIKDAR